MKQSGRWWNQLEARFVECKGTRVHFQGFEEFVFLLHRRRGPWWNVTEQSSGWHAGSGLTPSSAQLNAETNLRETYVEDFRRLVARAIRENEAQSASVSSGPAGAPDVPPSFQPLDGGLH